MNRVPASFFVSISYMCRAYLRQGVTLEADGKIGKWLYCKWQKRPRCIWRIKPFPLAASLA